MITFHEGMPRSGKSYEAMVFHIIPNIIKGRKVFAYIEGIDHAKIAEITDKSVDEVKDLLKQINREDVPRIHEVVENDSFVIIDELQNFWPTGRQKLDDNITQFVTEHGHRGLDILCMGQNLNDCHNLWKRRTQVKMTFTKQSMIGKGNKYMWQSYQAQLKADGAVKYVKIRGGSKKYDPKFFGTYKSHADGTENTENYLDDRTNILKSNTFRFGIPIFLGILFYALTFIYNFFTGEKEIVHVQKVELKQPKELHNKSKFISNAEATNKSNHQTNQVTEKPVVRDYISESNKQFKLRLSSKYRYKIENNEFFRGTIESYDMQNTVRDTFTFDQIKSLGWQIHDTSFGILIIKNNETIQITPWRIDPLWKLNSTNQTSSL